MALHVAESLACRGRFDPADVLERYLRWWRDGAFDTGPVSGRALELMSAGMPASEAAVRVHRESGGRTAGCNPAHRSSPLAMLASIPDDALAACATAEARLTHLDPQAGEVAAAVVGLCRASIRGVSWGEALRRFGLGGGGDVGDGGHAPEVLHAAVHFVGGSESFVEALTRSLAFAGAANYAPVLVGALGGARWGASAIPPSAPAHPDLLPRLRATADALAAGWSAD